MATIPFKLISNLNLWLNLDLKNFQPHTAGAYGKFSGTQANLVI